MGNHEGGAQQDCTSSHRKRTLEESVKGVAQHQRGYSGHLDLCNAKADEGMGRTGQGINR